ncbi:MSC_0624 family F1-like ATPase-associated membrane protein [Metamycoplasma canadense]|uniref:Transmembrane protein n=1 Tax=Metamycoplasma canadense TaxID=29554 RepID=A0A077L6Y1_9BACT|nr:hypothetical protein [Metamycoplasma canadense]BAP39782.1 hypothetical protein MCAN360_0758 [Metamycoplasma canadense]
MQNKNIYEKRIYDDFESMENNKKRNSIVSILKTILITFFVVSSALILFFSPLTIFSKKLFPNENIAWFLVFSNLAFERINYLALFRTFLLLIIFIYTISKNFSNIFTHKESTKKYIPWFITYLLFSLTSLILLFTFFKHQTLDYYYLSFISIFLLFIDIAYAVYTYKLKRKTNPLVYKNSKATIVSIISRIILVATFITILSIWIFSVQDKNKYDFLNNNYVHQFFINIFTQKDSKYLIYIILFFVFITIVIFGINIEKILLLASKQYPKNEIREKIILHIAFSFTSIIWFIRALFYKNSSDVIEAEKPSQNYLYLITIAFITLLFVSYLLISFIKKLKIKGLLLNNIFTSFTLLLIWISTTIVSLKNNETLITNLTILFASLYSIIIIMIYKLKTSNEPIYVSIFLKLLITLTTTTIVINGLNSLLLSYNNQAFYNIRSSLSLNQIFIISTLAIYAIFAFTILINFIVTISSITRKHSFLNTNKGGK